MPADGALASRCKKRGVTKFPIRAALAALVLSMPASAQPLLEGAADSLAERLLAVHNRERALVGAPPLQWDASLAAHAAS